MKKSIVISLIVAGVLVLVGAGLFAGAMSAAEWDFSVLNTYEVVNNTYDVHDPFNSIAIESDTADLCFVKSNDGKCRVETVDNSNHVYNVAVTDGTLQIGMDSKGKIAFGIGVYRSSVTVYLPEDVYGTLTVRQDTGDIEIPENFSFESIDMELGTGDVVSSADTAGTCRITTDTGDVKVQGVSVGALELRTTTGRITASDVACAGNVSINVSTGKIYLTDLTCRDLMSTGSSGDVTLKHVIASGGFFITRDSGDVALDGCDAAAIEIKTDTGDVEGTFLTPKIIYAQSNTGRIEVPRSTTGVICEITTDTGDIKILFKS